LDSDVYELDIVKEYFIVIVILG